jgi:EAL domain-containing protein (putative c-di-GMP-specific phosphodiesterase class I)/GGDEF domain-containing protein
MTRALYCGEPHHGWLLSSAALADEGCGGDARSIDSRGGDARSIDSRGGDARSIDSRGGDARSITLSWAKSAAAAREALRRADVDVILVDHGIEPGQGLAILAEAIELGERPVIYVVDDERETELLHQALELGAADVVVRSTLGPAELRWAVAKACRTPSRQDPGARLGPAGALPGQATFRDRVDRALHRARRTRLGVAVLCLRVLPSDREAERLRLAAEHLRRSIRATDSFCRFDAEGFLVLLEDLEEGRAAARVAERILEGLDAHRAEGDRRAPGAEVGIGLHPGDGSTPDALIAAARRAGEDEAAGVGTERLWLRSRPLHRRAMRRARLERALRRDLVTMAFDLHYQPRVDLRTGRAAGVEALLRYHPRELGPVGPSEVVPLLEEMEEIEAVGAWVLREACRAARALEDAGHPLVVGVNVSAHQIELGRLDRVVEEALAESGASPELLELELTEGVLIENTAGTRGLLTGLRDRGVRVAVDDFGTGYASLRYVKHFPMDTIKIDREFVHGLPSDPENAAITSAIIALAHRLHIEVVAEGVEAPAEEAFLREHGCDYVQGFLRSRPMPGPQILPWLGKRATAVSGTLASPAVDSETEIG